MHDPDQYPNLEYTIDETISDRMVKSVSAILAWSILKRLNITIYRSGIVIWLFGCSYCDFQGRTFRNTPESADIYSFLSFSLPFFHSLLIAKMHFYLGNTVGAL